MAIAPSVRASAENNPLARLYPFEIGAIIGGTWIAAGEPNFFRYAMFA
jgi:hypothetical protein